VNIKLGKKKMFPTAMPTQQSRKTSNSNEANLEGSKYPNIKRGKKSINT